MIGNCGSNHVRVFQPVRGAPRYNRRVMFWNRIGNSDDSSDDSFEMPPPEQLQGRPLGRVLIKMRKVTREQVVEALMYQKQHGGPLGEVMVKLGFIQPA